MSAWCALEVITTVTIVAGVGSGHRMVRNTPRFEEVKGENAGFVLCRVVRSLLPSYLNHRNTHLHPRNHSPMGHTLEILARVPVMALPRFRIQQANLTASRLSPVGGMASCQSQKGHRSPPAHTVKVWASRGAQLV